MREKAKIGLNWKFARRNQEVSCASLPVSGVSLKPAELYMYALLDETNILCTATLAENGRGGGMGEILRY